MPASRAKKQTPTTDIPEVRAPVIMAIIEEITADMIEAFRVYYTSYPEYGPNDERAKKAQRVSLDGVRRIGHVLSRDKYFVSYADEQAAKEKSLENFKKAVVLVEAALADEPHNPLIKSLARTILGPKRTTEIINDATSSDG